LLAMKKKHADDIHKSRSMINFLAANFRILAKRTNTQVISRSLSPPSRSETTGAGGRPSNETSDPWLVTDPWSHSVKLKTRSREDHPKVPPSRAKLEGENLTNDINNLKNEMNNKVDVLAWDKANDVFHAAIEQVRSMASSLRLELDACRRHVKENLIEDISILKKEMDTKLDTKVDNVAWKEANYDLDGAVKTVNDMVNLSWSEADARLRALNGRIDLTNKDLAATQESLHVTQNSLSDRFNEVAVGDLVKGRNPAPNDKKKYRKKQSNLANDKKEYCMTFSSRQIDAEAHREGVHKSSYHVRSAAARLKQQEAFEKMDDLVEGRVPASNDKNKYSEKLSDVADDMVYYAPCAVLIDSDTLRCSSSHRKL